MSTFEEYLAGGEAQGIGEYRLCPFVKPDGTVTFYIHPLGKNGTTADYRVMGNDLIRIENAISGVTVDMQPTPEPSFIADYDGKADGTVEEAA